MSAGAIQSPQSRIYQGGRESLDLFVPFRLRGVKRQKQEEEASTLIGSMMLAASDITLKLYNGKLLLGIA